MQTTLRWDVDLLSGYDHVFLRNLGHGDGYSRLINPGIVPALLRGRYDAVIFYLGWGTVTSLIGIVTCRLAGLPFLLWSDSCLPPPEDTIGRRIRAAFLRRLFRWAHGFLVCGRLNEDHYRHYGADPLRFFPVPFAVDNQRFEAGSRFATGEREALRAGLRIEAGQVAVVFSAKLLPRKDPMTLLAAVGRMRNRARVVVVFLGDGVLRPALESYARSEGIEARFPGFLNQSDLPKYYAMGDVFVLPSVFEPRGAVVHEAMACGLPVVVSDRCGASGDIVHPGENGFVFPAGDAGALAGHLDVLAEDLELRRRMGARSREIVADWNFAHGVNGVKEAARAAARRAS
jgi:glycosyltransferase involved in cell wall biosynthesis